jgi:hypothetical protein
VDLLSTPVAKDLIAVFTVGFSGLFPTVGAEILLKGQKWAVTLTSSVLIVKLTTYCNRTCSGLKILYL